MQKGIMSPKAIQIAARLTAVLFFAAVPPCIHAQGPTTPTQVVQYATATPTYEVGHDYIQNLAETVDPGNGQLSVRIKIPTPKGRGIDVPFGLNYDSAGLTQLAVNQTSNISAGVTSPPDGWTSNILGSATSGGWVEAYPMFYMQSFTDSPNINDENTGYQCIYSGNASFADITGSRHWLGTVFQTNNNGGADVCPITSNPQTVTTSDGKYQATIWGAIAVGNGNNGGQAAIAGLDGTTYTMTPGSIQGVVEDRNGNTVTYTPNNNNGTNVTDTLGRTIISSSFTPGNGSSTYAVSTYAIAETSNPYTATWSTPMGTGAGDGSLASSPNLVYSVINSPLGGNCVPGNAGANSSVASLGTLGLPDGTSYQFTYDPATNLLNQITYPNGATTTYGWGIQDTQGSGNSDDASFQWEAQSYDGLTGLYQTSVNSCLFQYGRPRVSKRIVNDGITNVLEQDFTYSTVFILEAQMGPGRANWSSKTTTVVTRDLLRGTSYTTTYTYVPNGMGYSQPFVSQYGTELTIQMSDWPAVESSVVTQSWNGNILQTENKTWNDPSHLLTDQTVLPTGQTSETDNTWYLGCGSDPHEMDIYDYGIGVKGSLLQKTVINCASFANTPIYPYGPSLLSFPSSVVVSNSSGTVSETDYAYDQVTVSPASAIQHDNTNYGAASSAPRANATTVTRKCLQNCSTPVTTYTYDQAGQVLSVNDPCGNSSCGDMAGTTHITTYGYTDSYAPGTGQPGGSTDAYVTSITGPLGFLVTYQYGYNDGKIRSIADVSNQTTTTFCYFIGGCSGSTIDPWVRLTEMDSPDKGRTTVTYVDTGSEPSTTVYKVINASTTAVNTTLFDAMGRATHARLDSDPDGIDYVDTVYDGESRIWKATNPYRSTSYGLNTYIYDSLGRKTSQIDSDGEGTQTWSYNGNVVTFQNENGNQWQRTSDGLGRLTNVVEPGSLVTNYAYDALNNLLQVSQLGIASTGDSPRTRTFNYDSLSRLLCASNPENSTASCPTAYPGYVAGTVGYSYDADGNLQTKTDARGVGTNHKYDVLNRLLWKTYTNAPAGTMSSCYQYDSAPNGVGRLAVEWTQPGSCASAPPANYQSQRKYGAYDAMGRVLTEQQCVAGYCTSTSVPSQPSLNCPSLSSATGLQYCYDFAGNLLAYSNGVTTAAAGSYPQQALLFSQTIDAAGRLNSVSSSWNDATHPQLLFSSPVYTPFNTLSSWQLGTQLTTTRSYDNRLRVTRQSSVQ
jgi:YD repeat-containing protein